MVVLISMGKKAGTKAPACKLSEEFSSPNPRRIQRFGGHFAGCVHHEVGASGCSRVPVGKLAILQLKSLLHGCFRNRQPVAHTCLFLRRSSTRAFHASRVNTGIFPASASAAIRAAASTWRSSKATLALKLTLCVDRLRPILFSFRLAKVRETALKPPPFLPGFWGKLKLYIPELNSPVDYYFRVQGEKQLKTIFVFLIDGVMVVASKDFVTLRLHKKLLILVFANYNSIGHNFNAIFSTISANP